MYCCFLPDPDVFIDIGFQLGPVNVYVVQINIFLIKNLFIDFYEDILNKTIQAIDKIAESLV